MLKSRAFGILNIMISQSQHEGGVGSQGLSDPEKGKPISGHRSVIDHIPHVKRKIRSYFRKPPDNLSGLLKLFVEFIVLGVAKYSDCKGVGFSLFRRSDKGKDGAPTRFVRTTLIVIAG